MADKVINTAFLTLCGFEGDELAAILPDWLSATEKLHLSDEDIRYATEEFIPQNWDVQYRGVRLMIGAWMRELIEVTKATQYAAQGVKIIYGILPAVVTPYTAFKYAGGDQVFVSFPDLLLVKLLNGIFHKAAPLLEEGERQGFTYGCRHCPLNKMRLAAYATGLVPSPDVIWSWGFNCDEGPKTDEMIQCLISKKWKYVISRIPHDTYYGEKDDEVERITYLSKVLQQDIGEMSKLTGIYPTEDNFKAALADSGRFMFKLGQLAAIISNSDPVPVGGSSLTLLQDAVGVPLNCGYQYMEQALDVLTSECRAAKKAGSGILPKGSAKMGSYFIPFVIPWVERLFRENGIALTFSQTLTPSKSQMHPSAYGDNVYMALAEQWLKMPLGQNMGYEAAAMVEKVQTYKPDGMLMGLFDFDRWLGAHQKMCADIVEKETGVPHYYMESDFWDDRDYSEEALRTRIESIAQLLYMKKEMK